MTAGLALFAVLFTDGMHVSFPKLRANWRNPARTLGLGMPLAFVGRPTRCSPLRWSGARKSRRSCGSC